MMRLADADMAIQENLSCKRPKSFILRAGAGSGKTHSLKLAIEHVLEIKGQELALHGQAVAVITYTNAAAEEIAQRIQYHPFAHVSTIHSFAWTLLRDFQENIRELLIKRLIEKIEDDEEKLEKPRTKDKEGLQQKIARTKQRLGIARTAKRFIYAPNGENREQEALDHPEVISFVTQLLHTFPRFRQILTGRHPFLFVDEMQDTDQNFLLQILNLVETHTSPFCVGLFGDPMQRIYPGGFQNQHNNLLDDWLHLEKSVNYRSGSRIIGLANMIRSSVDTHQQRPREDATEGFVRLFVASNNAIPREVESRVSSRMAELTGDFNWNSLNNDIEKSKVGVKKLVLEHTMASKRLGFGSLFGHFRDLTEKNNQQLLDNHHKDIRVLVNEVLPLIRAIEAEDDYRIMALLKRYSPLLNSYDPNKPFPDKEFRASLRALAEAVKILLSKQQGGTSMSLRDVISVLHERQALTLPAIVEQALSSNHPQKPALTGETHVWAKILECHTTELKRYVNYIQGKSEFDTHQGVKGLEFARVMVVINDAEAGGRFFSYEKLFGAQDPSATDLKNRKEGKETSIDRTRRLLYVTCTRAIDSLAIVAYSSNPISVREQALENRWFAETEIEMISEE